MVTPRFSIITAMYQAEQFLPDYIDALHAQSFDMSQVEVLIIDDSSTDASVRMVQERLNLPNVSIELIPHQGQAQARNFGLARARGEWVTFFDADDSLSPNYFEAVDAAITAAERTAPAGELIPDVFVARMLNMTADGTVRKARPASEWRFGSEDAVLNLNVNPDFTQSEISQCFIRRSSLVEHNISFSVALTTAFEGPHFLARVLMASTAPTIGLIQSAVYYSRLHSGSVSSRAWRQEQRYVSVLQHGHIDLCTRATELLGEIPLWLAGLIMKDLCFLLEENRSFQSATDWLSLHQEAECARLIRQVMELLAASPLESLYVEPQLLEPFQALLSLPPRNTFLQPRTATLVHDQPAPGLTTIRYQYQGSAQGEELLLPAQQTANAPGQAATNKASQAAANVHGQTTSQEPVLAAGREAMPGAMAVTPLYSGTEDVSFFRNFGYKVRTLIVGTNRDMRILLNGQEVAVELQGSGRGPKLGMKRYLKTGQSSANNPAKDHPKNSGNSSAHFVSHPPRARYAYLLSQPSRAEKLRKPLSQLKWSLKRFSNSDPVREIRMRGGLLRQHAKAHPREAVLPVKGAWVCYDSFDRADDNAEHFYRYLATHHPEIPSFYALDRSSPDWDRLAAEGFRLLDARGTRFQLISLHAECLISSHIDARMLYPTPALRYARKRPFYVFLQHGVSKNDISMWLRTKPFDLIVTTAPAEHEYFIGSESAYGYTDFQVALTGQPRWDRLSELAQLAARNEANAGKNRVVFMPTWRANLARELALIDDPAQRARAFAESEYLRPWLEAVHSPELATLAQRHGVLTLLVIHPALSRLVDLELAFPGDSTVAALEGVNVQELLTRTHTLVTDFSSIAFDAAFIDREVIYFHPDGNRIFQGGHNYRAGFFNEAAHGFGPVTTTPGELLIALESSLSGQSPIAATFAARREEFFGTRDQLNSARTFDAIVERLNLLRPR